MHNGKHSLPGAEECVRYLARDRGLPLIILSNTSSPSKTTLGRLPGLGFEAKDFVGAVTSGEEAARIIRETYGRDMKDEKKKFVWFTWSPGNTNAPDPLRFLEKCGNVEPTLDPSEADFVVAHGSGCIRGAAAEDGGETPVKSMGSFIDDADLTEVDKILRQCARRNLPLICANPDLVVLYHEGGFKHMPGKIARRYESEEMEGNSVKWFGKPHASHFEACLRELGLDRSQVAHVGDSLHHDIAGANAAGVDSIFIAGGIHRGELQGEGEDSGELLLDEERLQALFKKEGHTPTHVLPMFRL
uniref:Uncharacterized protein n=1 Tax=Corethron hystrix TaxID=216773 RepID=A0A7S1B597_9STRA